MADDIHLFKALGKCASPPKPTAELATLTATEPALLGRVLRHLAAKGVITELGGQDTSYHATELSEILSSPEGSSGIRHVAQLYTPIFQQLPDYLKSIDYVVPRDNQNGPFQQTIGKPGECNAGLQLLVRDR